MIIKKKKGEKNEDVLDMKRKKNVYLWIYVSFMMCVLVKIYLLKF